MTKILFTFIFALCAFMPRASVAQLTPLLEQAVGREYVTNGGFENGISGWKAYKNTAQATPLTGTGGSPTTDSITVSSSSPMTGKFSGVMGHLATNGQGEGVSYDFVVDPAARGKALNVNISYQVTAGSYTSGDVVLYLYDVTAAALVTNAVYVLPRPASTTQTMDAGFSVLLNDSSTNYRLILHSATATATAFTLKLDRGSGRTGRAFGVQLFPDTADTDYGPTTILATTTNPTKGTVVTDHFWGKRVGNALEARIEFNQSAGGTAGSGDYLFEIPAATGCRVDSAKITYYTAVVGLTSPQATNVIGTATTSQTTPSAWVGFVSAYDSSHVRLLGLNGGSTGAASSSIYSLTAAGTYAAKFSVPCAGWVPLTAIDSKNSNYDWTAWVPVTSAGMGATTFQGCKQKREGPNLKASCTITAPGATGSEMRVGLPNGLITSTNTNILPFNPGGTGVGLGTGTKVGTVTRNAGTGSYDTLVVVKPGVSYVNVATASPANGGMTIQGETAIYGSGETFTLEFEVPIDGWTENQNAPQLIGSVVNPGPGVLYHFAVQWSGSATYGSTPCSINGNCILGDSSAPAGTVVAGDSSGNYTITVPAGVCSGPLVCRSEGIDGSHLVFCESNGVTAGGFNPPTNTAAKFVCFSLNPLSATTVVGQSTCDCRK